MDVEEIRSRILSSYNSFSSYQDQGIISLRSFTGEKSSNHFRTLFLRPDRVLFEWGANDPGRKLFTLSIVGKEAEFKTFAIPENSRRLQKPLLAVVDRTLRMLGPPLLSFGMCDNVVPILIQSPTKRCFINERLIRLDDEEVDGEPCFQVRVLYAPERFWISKNDFTVRQCRSNSRGPLDAFMYKGCFRQACSLIERIGKKQIDPFPESHQRLLDAVNLTECRYKDDKIQSSHGSQLP